MHDSKQSVIGRHVFIVVLVTFLTGCTTYLESKHISTIADNQPKGMLYSLPMLQYEFDITRQITSCNVEIEVKTTVEVNELFLPDPGATFELDYMELSGITNTSEIEAEFYDNGTLKSINVEADDRTADILTNSFKIISSAALAAASVPPLPAVRDENRPACNQETIEALAALKESEDSLKRRTKNVETASEEVARLNPIVTGADKPSEEILKSLQDAIKKLKEHKLALVNLNKNRAPYLARTQYKEKLRWPKTTANDSMKTKIPPNNDLTIRWFKKEPGKVLIGEEILDSKLALHFQINQLVEKLPSSDLHEKNKGYKGIFYRYPMPVELEVCTDAPCDSQSRKTIKIIQSKTPQHGPLVLLPFENGAFKKYRFEVVFSPSGVPSKLSFKNQRSAAAEATSAAAGIAEQLPGLRQQLLNADLEKLKRQTALLKQEKALLDAEKSLEKSTTLDTEAETALIKAQTDLINAQIALQEAQQRLDELK